MKNNSELDQLILAHITTQSGFHAGKNTIGDVDEAGNKIKYFFHQELQKARKNWLWEEVKKLKVIKRSIEEFDYDCDERGKCEILQTIIDRYHSELDQDNTHYKIPGHHCPYWNDDCPKCKKHD